MVKILTRGAPLRSWPQFPLSIQHTSIHCGSDISCYIVANSQQLVERVLLANVLDPTSDFIDYLIKERIDSSIPIILDVEDDLDQIIARCMILKIDKNTLSELGRAIESGGEGIRQNDNWIAYVSN